MIADITQSAGRVAALVDRLGPAAAFYPGASHVRSRRSFQKVGHAAVDPQIFRVQPLRILCQLRNVVCPRQCHDLVGIGRTRDSDQWCSAPIRARSPKS